MGKKGSWFSAIKRVFTHSSKDKPTSLQGPDKKNIKDKKKGKFLFREPSSIEKILGEADQLLIRPPTSSQEPKTPPLLFERLISPRISSPKIASRRDSSAKDASLKVSSPRVSPPKPHSPRATSPKPVSHVAAPIRDFSPGTGSSKTAAPKVTQNRREISYVQRPEPTLQYQHLSATKIQAAYRGYLARRSFRALKGLVRLQEMMRGQNVKRQTLNAMKQMQQLVRVQTQIQSRRIQMLESQALQRQNDKEVESTLSKWTQFTESDNNEYWDDSSITKEEANERLRKKVEAVIKRERAMAYAYSHQGKSNPRSAQGPLDIQSNGYPWWWNWLERQPPPAPTSQIQPTTKNITFTPPRPFPQSKPSPRLHEPHTPTSSKSFIPVRPKQFQTPSRTPPGFIKYSKPRTTVANSAYDVSIKDDDSLMSCPPFSAPNYMTPTVSAKAKVRANSNPKERFPGTPGSDSRRRFSFPLTPNIGSFRWNKGSNKDSTSQIGMEKHNSSNLVDNMSIDSAVSMPTLVGRKPFNRFV